MAPPPRRRERPVRTLVTLAVLIVALFASIFAGTRWGDASLTPNLALDLEGGTQIILQPVPEAKGDVTAETINQAIAVIRQRVDASGVAEAEITSQGGDKIVVGLPGRPSEETLDLVRTSAQMEFRPVLVMGAAAPTADPTADPATDDAAPSDQPTKAAPDSPSDVAYYVTPAVQKEFEALDCTLPENRTGGVPGDPEKAVVACDVEGTAKFILGPVEIPGADIKSATSGTGATSTGASTGQWVVNLEFTGAGTPKFTEVTTRLAGQGTAPLNQFAVVLDALVISAPSVNEVIPNGQAQISGSFTRETAATLANQLNFGSLPISFEEQSVQQISATLGSEQLQKGLLAGVFGLLLVVVYSLFQYRTLGLVTVASLLVAAVITYGVIALLSWVQGYRLSLPGVAGIIVAIGITADSFIVYFERIRDELRDGRSLGAAIEKGWERARRTILASDAVNFTAAIVLYLLAVGGVRGFAFTLGLTTIVDLVVVFMFTHPLMVLLGRTRFFADGHPASGLDPRRLGVDVARYAGRGRVKQGVEQRTGSASAREPVAVGAPGLTIAERRAAARAAGTASAPPQDPPTTTDDEPTTGRPEGSDR
ncbi:protein translocase subunit SecD [Cellulomonas xiejunii]|uniref:Protein translocase subunit SecD n=1 Tax=Cellulomonas xiejunii TaxID=2968083 RepID=A0ABY5KST8_9CELL|nr:protein translocase subunit SecD [Cellulomonas xiejunii]MCC2314788.1 protein translocase subunit SecD [Cellulomonas xiejunii]MCC2323070.1 protein translocase subunit SecD [Cellulomonas xiejunii]UUI73562.1 protein translocase subunit SecD [Cellulomonas xiejunii]